MLGEFEYLLLTAAVRLRGNASGAAIRPGDPKPPPGAPAPSGALYATVDRLEAKEPLLQTWMGEATAQRGGRAKRMVRVSAKGIDEASKFYAAVTHVSRGVSWETT